MRYVPRWFLPLILTLLFSSCAFGFGRARAHIPVDVVTASSLVDGDATGLAEGCGQQPSPLGMFCRQVEGDAADKSISLIGPPAACARADSCVFVKVYNNQGNLVYGGSIPKGQTRVTVPWATLLACPAGSPCLFHLGDRGFWTFNTTVYFTNPEGREASSVSQGDIVLRVFKAGYIPLHSVANDPNYAWTWQDGGFLYRVTTGLRAFVGRAVIQ